MTQSVDDLVSQAQELFAAASNAAALENAKARFLGKDGALTVLLKGLGKLDPEQKRDMGARINQAKQKVEELPEPAPRRLGASGTGCPTGVRNH